MELAAVSLLLHAALVLIYSRLSRADVDYYNNYNNPSDNNDYDTSYMNVKCYKCTSKDSIGCMDPFNMTAATICQTGDACLVVTTTIMGVTTVHRGCTNSQSIDYIPRCTTSGDNDIVITSCSCFRSLCNGASDMGLTNHWGLRAHTVILALAALIYNSTAWLS